MAELDTVLATVRERVAKYGPQGIGEQDTKAALIVPVLRALGWETEDLEDVIYVANADLNELQKFFTLLNTLTGPVITGFVVKSTVP